MSHEKRYEVGVLIGPCGSEEAEEFMTKVADYIYDDLGHPLGACVSLELWEEEREE